MTLAPRRLCLIITVTYSTWIIAPLLDPGLHPWTSYASEYFVANRPAATLLRTTDGVSGVLLVVIAVVSYTRARILWRGLPVGLDASSVRVLQASAVPPSPHAQGVVRGARMRGAGDGRRRRQSDDVPTLDLSRLRRGRNDRHADVAA